MDKKHVLDKQCSIGDRVFYSMPFYFRGYYLEIRQFVNNDIISIRESDKFVRKSKKCDKTYDDACSAIGCNVKYSKSL